MAVKRVVFDAEELVQLLLHYNDGKDIPLDVKLNSVGISQILDRYICLNCTSENWLSGMVMQGGIVSPLHMRYRGKRIMTLNRGGDSIWKDANSELQ